MRICKVTFFLLLLSTTVKGQDPTIQRTGFPLGTEEFSSNKASVAPTGFSDYRIGSNDFLLIEVFGEPSLASAKRVLPSGTISLNLLGPIEATGLTTRQLEAKIEKTFLDRKLINEPHVTVTVQEYASQPVQILGAVNTPNIYQLKGEKTLLSMVALAGGLDDNVGRTIQVMRGGLGDPSDPTKKKEVISVSVEDFQNTRIGMDIPIYANDAIYVSIAESVFVAGEFTRPDEFILRNGKGMSVIQAYGKAGGFTREAKKKEAVIIRIHQGGAREDIPLNIDKMLKNEAPDVTMLPNDILYVPSNRAKAAFNRTLESAVSIVTGRLIYRF
jgi:polysaccharide export outer membrane protein